MCPIDMFNKLFLAFALILVAGCGHNTGALVVGTRVNLGVDPQNVTANISYVDGLSLLDMCRENSEWIVEVDSNVGVKADKDGTIKGVKSFKRCVGPQITGYLVEIAKTNPELAREYVEAVKYYWQSRCNKDVK